MSGGDGGDDATVRELAQMGKAERATWGRQLTADLKEVRRQLREARKAAAQAIKEARARLREAKGKFREERKRTRAKHRTEWAELIARERQAIHDQHHDSLAKLKAAKLDKIALLKAKEAAVLRRKMQLDALTGNAQKRLKANLQRQARESESDDAVRTELEKFVPEAVGWWDEHKGDKRFAARKIPKRTSRAEFVIEALEAEPERFLRWQQHHAEKRVEQLERLEAEKAALHSRRHRVIGRAERLAARTAGRANRQKAARGTSYARDVRAGEAAPF